MKFNATGSLLPADLHACDPAWKSVDHDGHGTEMAGLALYGDLAAFVRSSGPAILRHRLESVKILPPPPGQNRPELYGAITAEAVSRVEIKAPTRRRGFSLAVTADANGNLGKPTSWSAAIDALAAGRSFDPSPKGLAYLADDKEGPRRLFVVCAGNVNTTEIDHLARSDTEEIREPGQAWNALTVGACTELVNLDPRDPLLRACSKSPRSEAAQHDANHGHADHGLTGGSVEFIVLAQSALSAKPAEGALNNPTTRQDFEAANIVTAFHDLQPDTIARAQIADPVE